MNCCNGTAALIIPGIAVHLVVDLTPFKYFTPLTRHSPSSTCHVPTSVTGMAGGHVCQALVFKFRFPVMAKTYLVEVDRIRHREEGTP